VAEVSLLLRPNSRSILSETSLHVQRPSSLLKDSVRSWRESRAKAAMILGDLRRGLKSVREHSSFAPLGLDHFPRCTHGLRRGLHSFGASRLETAGLFHCESLKQDLMHTLEAAPFQNRDQKRVLQQPAVCCRRLHRSFAADTAAQDDNALFCRALLHTAFSTVPYFAGLYAA
jgi:hypothetical protein